MTAEPITALEPAPAPAPQPGLAARLSDRLNPILVREVQQAVKGRTFVLTVFGSLLVTVVIALGFGGQTQLQERHGNEAFRAVLAAFCPVALFLVPLGAYASMRHELRAGIVEQLLLSRLRPWRIVAGKMASSMVQFFLYLSVFAPVLSMTYLLRGVDLPTIGLCLGFGLLFSLVATTFAIAAAAQTVFPPLQVVSNVGMMAALAAATIGCMAMILEPFLLRGLSQIVRQPEFWAVMSAMVLMGVAAVVLFAMVGAALLAHGYENKSTGFRVFLLVAAGLTFGWIAWFCTGGGAFAGRNVLRDLLPGAAIALAIGGAAFGVFVVGENAALSPRMRARAPRRRLPAMLVAPLLPGRGRGLMFLLTYLLGVAAVAALWNLAAGMPLDFDQGWGALGMVLAYAVVFLGLTMLVRNLLPETPVAGMATRAILPLLLLAGCGVPALFDALLGGGIRSWHPGHILNPFWTLDQYGFRSRRSEAGGVLLALLVLAVLVVLLHARGMLRGFAEVVRAHADQRQRPERGDAA